MVSADRQTIMEVNRSLRTIKNELENLLEKGVIDEQVYDEIHSTLPEESPLSGPLRTAASRNATPASTVRSNGPTSPPAAAMANLDIAGGAGKSPSPAPPSYEDTPPPNLPSRNNPAAAAPPPGPPPSKPVIAHARALYQYNASDGRDLAMEKDDKVSVHEYMNQDWWMGTNQRTGLEGIFPRNYVLVENESKAPVPQEAAHASSAYAPQSQPQYGYPQNQPYQNPYDSSVPPMAVANGSGQPSNGEPSKKQEMGKKFGKKLGNAAIFGAGATIGGNIVNSIF
ncbi:LAS seventeen-binding protein 1/2 [Geosmithia morbida]|uniref:LAS seventeen-binding protein 1/2 n=1 Tax=Geosmithia morbida TaxID=1094350 RepID=A0A9P4YZJ4_9HYPO|nr:LAS seventeen-binding protein 1/2 [Geosmithia morbida]KAF4124528.1 LAS seventeen-binding protein 1/2 [Geosmithia morbida]